MKLSDLLESSDNDSYWKSFAKAMTKLRGAEVTLKSSKDVKWKNDLIGREASFTGAAVFTIKQDWKNDGTSTKPVTTLHAKGEKINLGRFVMWAEWGDYADDINRVLEKHGLTEETSPPELSPGGETA